MADARSRDATAESRMPAPGGEAGEAGGWRLPGRLRRCACRGKPNRRALCGLWSMSGMGQPLPSPCSLHVPGDGGVGHK